MKKSQSPTDAEILEAIRADRKDGWIIFTNQFDPLIRSITNWSKWHFSNETQQDVRQEVYIALQRALPRFRGECTLAWYIKRISINCCIDEVDQQAKRRNAVVESNIQPINQASLKQIDIEYPNTQTPRTIITQKEQLAALDSALGEVLESCRKSIELYYLRGYSYRQISEELGISINTVGSRLAKCLDKLQQTLKNNPLFERTRS